MYALQQHAHFQKGGAFLGGGEVADLVNNRLPVVAHSWLIEILAIAPSRRFFRASPIPPFCPFSAPWAPPGHT